MNSSTQAPRRKRARVSASGDMTIPHAETVRPGDDTGLNGAPTFPSQELAAHQAHQLPHPDSLMSNHAFAPSATHSSYPEPPAGPTVDGMGHEHHHHQQQQQAAHQQQQQQTPSQSQQQRQAQAGATPGGKAGNRGALFYDTNPQPSPGTVASQTPVSAGGPYNVQGWMSGGPGNGGGAGNGAAAGPSSPAPGASLAPPPEGIYRSFEDLLAAVQRVAKDQGYGVVKLRASNYRDGKATRYDLVCDRGGVKYASTAKKRNPSTRKVDCPWRAKAVCEVQLGNQWRFVVQESRHNHEARVPAVQTGQENTPVAQSMRSMMNKLDRISHELAQGFKALTDRMDRFDQLEKRVDVLEQGGRGGMLAGNGGPSIAPGSMPTANMGGPGLGNGPMSNGPLGGNPMVDSRLSTMEARLNAMEQRQNGVDMPMNLDEDGRMNQMII